MSNSFKAENRKFKSPSNFKLSNSLFYLLPFRFEKINESEEVIVNEVGDFLIVPIGTANKIVNREITSDNSLIPDLYANYFISDQPIPELIDVYATRYRTKKSFLDDFTGLHIFVITLRCEHTCKYCQVSRVTQDKERFDMSYSDIDKAIALMMKTPNPKITMEFQGGEPFLAFEKIKYAVNMSIDLALLNGKSIQHVICTNLAVVTEEMLNFCNEKGILISTSLDGPKFLHDSNRKKPNVSSYDKTITGINLSRKILGHDSVSALMTATKLSLNYPEEIVDEYFNQGFSDIFLRNISPYGFALRTENLRYDTSEFLEFYKVALNRIIDYNKRGHFYVENFAKIILEKMLTPFNGGFVDLQSPSGVISSVVVYNYDGAVYASDESRMLGEQRDFTFKLGTLEDSYESIFFGRKAMEIAQFSVNESLAGCSDCAFQSYCGADPVHNWSTQGDMYGYRPTSDYCKKNMEIIKYLMNLINEEENEIMPIFNSWINNNPS